MQTSEQLLELAKRYAFQSAVIPTQRLRFSQAVVDACKANYCGRYNKTWTCPPAVGTLESLREGILKYARALVFTTKHDLEDSFDMEGMDRGREEHNRAEAEILANLPVRDYRVLGAGGCGFCGKCTYPDAPCRFPERARPSVEACGIDVVQLARTCGVNYSNGPNTVTYFTVVLFD